MGNQEIGREYEKSAIWQAIQLQFFCILNSFLENEKCEKLPVIFCPDASQFFFGENLDPQFVEFFSLPEGGVCTT